MEGYHIILYRIMVNPLNQWQKKIKDTMRNENFTQQLAGVREEWTFNIEKYLCKEEYSTAAPQNDA